MKHLFLEKSRIPRLQSTEIYDANFCSHRLDGLVNGSNLFLELKICKFKLCSSFAVISPAGFIIAVLVWFVVTTFHFSLPTEAPIFCLYLDPYFSLAFVKDFHVSLNCEKLLLCCRFFKHFTFLFWVKVTTKQKP